MLSPDGTRAHLAGSARLPVETPASPASMELSDAQAPWPVLPVVASGQPMLVEELSAPVAAQLALLATEALPAPQAALVLPKARAGEDQLAGFLVAGLNPRRELDEDYRGFLQLVAGQVATGIASARAYQEAEERSLALAELDRAKTVFFNNISHEFRTPLTLTLGRWKRCWPIAHARLPGPARPGRTGPPQCLAPAQTGQYAARFCAHRGRASRGRL